MKQLGKTIFGQLGVSWIDLAVLFGFSVLFLFSMGAGLLPVDITMLILLGIIQYLGGVNPVQAVKSRLWCGQR